MYRTFFSLLLATVATSVLASDFRVQVKLLQEKADLCLKSIQVQKCGTTKFCKDHDSYSDYIFKGSATTWISYHMENKDLHQGNFDATMRAMKTSLEATEQAAQAAGCEP